MEAAWKLPAMVSRGNFFWGAGMWKGLAVTTLCIGSFLTLAVYSAEKMRESYSFIGVVQLRGQAVGVLRPMRPVSLGVIQEAGEPVPQGEVLPKCDAASRERVLEDNLSTKVSVHEMTLTCGKRLFVVKGILYDAR